MIDANAHDKDSERTSLMANNLFITATEARSGKSAICLGIMELLLRHIDRVAFFRPLINPVRTGMEKDNDIDLITSQYNLNTPYDKTFAFSTIEAGNLIALGKDDEFLEGVFEKYKSLEADHDFILCEGTDYGGSSSAFEFDINAEIAKNLGCPVLLVANAHQKSVDETVRSIEISIESLMDRGCNVIATVANRIHPEDRDKILDRLHSKGLCEGQLLYTIPNNRALLAFNFHAFSNR